jgi:hypothetical protein
MFTIAPLLNTVNMKSAKTGIERSGNKHDDGVSSGRFLLTCANENQDSELSIGLQGIKQIFFWQHPSKSRYAYYLLWLLKMGSGARCGGVRIAPEGAFVLTCLYGGQAERSSQTNTAEIVRAGRSTLLQ